MKVKEAKGLQKQNRQRKLRALCIIALSVSITSWQPFAIAQQEPGRQAPLSAGSGADMPTDSKELSAKPTEVLSARSPEVLSAKPPKAKANDSEAGDSLALDDIQDVGYTLQRIRQQAINVYVESTRKTVKGYELNIHSLSSMPKTPLEDESEYLPLRKAWLVFFIGTMEPLVQILNEDIKHLDEKAIQAKMPSQCIPEWKVIVNDWIAAVKGLNEQLDVCAALVDDDAPGNIAVAKAAVSMDSRVTTLEAILRKASQFLHHNMPAP